VTRAIALIVDMVRAAAARPRPVVCQPGFRLGELRATPLPAYRAVVQQRSDR
jgi:hypothetical protein